MKRAPLSPSRPHPSFASPWNNLPQVDDGLQDQGRFCGRLAPVLLLLFVIVVHTCSLVVVS